MRAVKTRHHMMDPIEMRATYQGDPIRLVECNGGRVIALDPLLRDLSAIYIPSDPFIVMVNPLGSVEVRDSLLAAIFAHHLFEHECDAHGIRLIRRWLTDEPSTCTERLEALDWAAAFTSPSSPATSWRDRAMRARHGT